MLVLPEALSQTIDLALAELWCQHHLLLQDAPVGYPLESKPSSHRQLHGSKLLGAEPAEIANEFRVRNRDQILRIEGADT